MKTHPLLWHLVIFLSTVVANYVQAQIEFTHDVGLGIKVEDTRFVQPIRTEVYPSGLTFLSSDKSSYLIHSNNGVVPRFLLRSNLPRVSYEAGYSATDSVIHQWNRTEFSGSTTDIMTLNRNGHLYVKTLAFVGDKKNMQYDDITGQIGYDNSSRRYKINITTLNDDWMKILHTRPVKYSRHLNPDHWEYGYIAEEMDSIGLTNLVGYDQDGIPDDVKYDRMVLYLTEVVKLQQQELAQCQVVMQNLSDELELLKTAYMKSFEQLETRLATLSTNIHDGERTGPGGQSEER